jgi:hypothetical protein
LNGIKNISERDKWLLVTITGAIIIAITYINRKTIVEGVKAISDYVSNLQNYALQEFKAWGNGTKKENDKSMQDTIAKYWKEGAGIKNWSTQRMQDEAWSSAFISYIVKKSGGGKDFKYSPSHSTYINDSIKNRLQNNSNPFKGYRPEEVKLEIGDIVGKPRQSGVTYNSKGAYKSHTDIVVAIKDGFAEMVGGNVGNSVSMTKVPLTSDGKIDNSKVSGYKYFVVIKNNK